MSRQFRRIAIVNRGEAAMRLIAAVREINAEEGLDLRTIALHTGPDRRALFVREADEAFDLGEATFVDPADAARKTRYVDYARLEDALRSTGAEAAWTGWGFVSEHAAFAELCARLGVVFVGPPPAPMRLLGDKIACKRLAAEAGIPVVPWSEGAVTGAEEAREAAGKLGFPLLVKASAGGGGRGIRRVASAAELPAALEACRAEARLAFGDPTVFLEALVEPARHVEVQVVADAHGTVWAAGLRECSLQRRHQKIVEEAPAPGLSPERERELRDWAVALARRAGYQSLGTAEFLVSPSGRVAFIEVNTRLQVEHGVTELTTGLDLVKLQLRLARGERLVGEPPATAGHAMEARLNAEDPDEGFAPAAGTLALLRLPTGPGLRVDRGTTEGDAVPAEFDPTIAKVMAVGRDRKEALGRLRRALSEAAIVVEGGSCNRPFLVELLSREEVDRAELDTGLVERVRRAVPPDERPLAGVALLQAAVEASEAERARELVDFYRSAARLRPELRPEVGRAVELRHCGHRYRARVRCTGPAEHLVEVDGVRLPVGVEVLSRFERRLTVGGRRHRTTCLTEEGRYVVEVDGTPHRFSRDDLGLVRAGSPAMVVSVAVKAGDAVEEGQPLVVLEAMKMETTLVAPLAGRVRQVHVVPNVQVGPGALLLQLDPAHREEERGHRIRFGPPPPEPPRSALEDLLRMVRGYEVDAPSPEALVCGPEANGRRERVEEAAFASFADVASLFRRTAPAEEGEEPEALSPGEYFLTYLRDLETRGSALPASFMARLRRALAHYGVTGLEPTPALREALCWIFKSHRRAEQQVGALVALLERRLGGAPEARFALVLGALAEAAEGRHPLLADAAREVRFQLFDRPLYEDVRRRAHREVEAHLATLSPDGDCPGRGERLAALVECPQPLEGLLSSRLPDARPALRRLLLEVLTRRPYRIRDLTGFETGEAGGRAFVRADYDLDGRPIRLLGTHAPAEDVAAAAGFLGTLADEAPAGSDVVLDLHLWRASGLGEAEADAVSLRAALDAALGPRRVRRAVVALSGPDPGGGPGLTRHFTFRAPGGAPFAEDRLYRGFHPMIGKRLRLERLRRFDVERLPSADDVYLLRGVARENPKDQRLFAFTEVRDATPVRETSGRVVQLPHLERMLLEALAAMRAFQSRRRPEERLHWNRVFVEVVPPVPLAREELLDLARRLRPATEGLGLDSVSLRGRLAGDAGADAAEQVWTVRSRGGHLVVTSAPGEGDEEVEPLSEYQQKVTRMRQRGLTYPYEILRLLTASEAGGPLPPGSFEEHDLDGEGRLTRVDRPWGLNRANVVVGLVSNRTALHPEGLTRVVLLGDPSREMGSVAEPECRRILAALDLAAEKGLPLEWFTLSAGAKISMESGTENMDWISKVLRRLVEFTQGGGEVDVVVCGINVGAQPYWNAEATMLMHTKGILVMTPDSAMVLTGKTALDYSGSVSAEDNTGIGGYERVMGPNGQAQYWARDVAEACRILLRHHEHAYVVPGERFPRRAPTSDPLDRDVRLSPHGGSEPDAFATVGDVFSDEKNPGRKRPFDIRRVMAAAIDQDHAPLERWAGMREAEVGVVWDARIGGIPVALLGFESHAIPRVGFVPTDGPEQWTSGTLFPRSSKKIARAINAASGSRPLVILANLSGFDGSPESMRRLQLEYGAEIGRAVVNFCGPVVFVVVSRYHGGAFVVFSRTLHDNMQVAALQGTKASVIGGAPAAAVVFSREVDARTRKDPRVAALEARVAAAADGERRRLRQELAELVRLVRSEKLGEVAEEFDRVHSVERALAVGSLDAILPPERLRPWLVEALERGLRREQERR